MTLKLKKLSPPYPTIKTMGGKTLNLRRLAEADSKLWSAFNPSIAYSPKYGYAMTVRSSNYIIDLETGYLQVTAGAEVASRMWFCELDEDFSLLNFREVKFESGDLTLKRGVEDAKLFWRDGSWWFTAVMLEKGHTPFARMSLFKYDPESNIATFIQKYNGPEFTKPEKNWMIPYEPNPNFDFIYGPASIIKNDVFIKYPNLNHDISMIRGNTNLWQMGDEYLAVVHSLYTKKIVWDNPKTFSKQGGLQKFYTHQFAKYNYKGELTHISQEFQFEQNGIEFAAGLVEKGNDFIISYGKDDLSSHLAIIPKDTVLNSLQEIPFR